MPRQAKKSKKDEGTVHEDLRENGISEEALTGFVSEYENESAEMARIMSLAVKACQPHKDEQKKILKAAAEAGAPKKVFKAKLNERADLRRAESRRIGLKEADQELFDEITEKMKGMPLWDHADEEEQDEAA